MSSQIHSSPFPSCFRPSPAADDDHRQQPPPPPPPPPPPSLNPSLTTTLYHTNIALFALTWSRTLFGRSLHLNLLLHNSATGDDDDEYNTTADVPSFHLHIKPFIFWNKHGSKKLILHQNNNHQQPAHIYWDLSKAKFGSGPEPVSGFYIAVVIDNQINLVIGDSHKQAYSKIKSSSKSNQSQITVLRREHVYGIGNNRRYTTKASFGGKTRDISIDCRFGEHDSRLNFHVDSKRVLQVKHLKWKFRGNERVEIDGVYVQVSWDVYNWLFEEEREDGHALFMFRFEKSGFVYNNDNHYLTQLNGFGTGLGSGFGLGFEMKKMKKGGMLGTARSSSSSSLSSASSSCGSVMEWESVEENELKGPSGFSLLVYAWKS